MLAVKIQIPNVAELREEWAMQPFRQTFGTRAAVATILALVASPGSAARRQADCLWTALPQASRAAIVASYARAGSDALADVPVADALIRAIARTCLGLADDHSMPLVGAAIAGSALEHAAKAALLADGVSPARLDKAWTLTPRAEKTLVLENAASAGPADRADAKPFFDAMASLAVRAGAPPPASRSPMNDRPFRTYVDYFLGRAQREAFQMALAANRR